MSCSACGTENQRSRFCTRCGRRLPPSADLSRHVRVVPRPPAGVS